MPVLAHSSSQAPDCLSNTNDGPEENKLETFMMGVGCVGVCWSELQAAGASSWHTETGDCRKASQHESARSRGRVRPHGPAGFDCAV